MGSGTWLQAGQNVSDPHLQFGYPADDAVLVWMVKGPHVSVQVIWYKQAPGADFDNAPQGSIYIDYVNGVQHIKKSDGTWT